MSLIVDESNSEFKKSGSNIGKTTAVKIIDICLGEKKKSYLYYEKDTGNNLVIERFIHENKVEAELIISDGKRNYSLKRALYKNGNNYIDGESYKYNENEYVEKLNYIIFKNTSAKPTLGQLIRKFIRLDTSNEEALFKFLGHFVTNPEYQAIYTYLLGIANNKFINVDIDQDNEKIDKDIEAIYRKNAVSSFEEFQVKIELLQEELNKFEKDYKGVSVIKDYKGREQEIQELLEKTTGLENECAIKKLRKKIVGRKN